MTIGIKPEVWMIAITDNPISMYFKNEVISSWEGYVVNHFEAKTPKDLTIDCDFLNLAFKQREKSNVEFSDTEKAVWYSHYFLWKRCWDTQTPIIIVEHDVKLLEEIEDEVFENDIVCLCHDTRENSDSKPKLAGGAYYIKPKVARELMKIRHNKKIINNSDAWIHSTCDKFGKWYDHKCEQFKNSEVGTTIVHNKV
jgi:GR25 family glycosyltransferase involved in LPS biosynthesis